MENKKDEFNLNKYMPSKSDIKNISSFFYAFSDDTRLRIIILLILKPLCVTEVSQILNINQTTVSHQLKILKSLDIVDGDRNGKNIVYFIKKNNIEEVLNAS
ncbi:MAG: helix-turn-helix transcriptional regulator, partial [Clostridia bacterium]|nr:helix-turn-helix transcriptional regulator [Clostridia bacterium]